MGGAVFIVGAPRSGTSILYRTLLKHPSFAVEGDEALQLAESAILESLPAAPRWNRPRPPRLWLYFLQDATAYDAFLAEVHRITGDRQPGPAAERPPWTAEVLEAFVRHARAARRCSRLIEKTPTHVERAEWLLDSLPNSRLVFIHRHPVDTYASYRRRADVDPKAGWADLTVNQFVDVYVRQGRIAQRLTQSVPGRFRAIGYERFTASPATVTAEVCEFVGERFLPTMVEEPQPDLGRARHDPHLYGEITPYTKDSREFVDGSTAAEVLARTSEVAARWDYHDLPAGY